MVNTTNDPQLAMDEVVLEDADLLAALNDREAKKAAVKPVSKAFREADEKAQKLIPADENVGKTFRVGPFRIKVERTEEKDVAFTRGGKVRASIELAE